MQFLSALACFGAIATVVAHPFVGPRSNHQQNTTVVGYTMFPDSPSVCECQHWHLTKNTTDTAATPKCGDWTTRASGAKGQYTLLTVQVKSGVTCQEWHIEVADGDVTPICGRFSADEHSGINARQADVVSELSGLTDAVIIKARQDDVVSELSGLTDAVIIKARQDDVVSGLSGLTDAVIIKARQDDAVPELSGLTDAVII